MINSYITDTALTGNYGEAKMSLFIVAPAQQDQTVDSVSDALESAGVTVLKRYAFGRYLKVNAEQSQLDEIENITYTLIETNCSYRVEAVNTDHLKYTVDPTGNTAFDPKYTGKGVDVFLLDTGVMLSHTELADADIINFYSAYVDSGGFPDFGDPVGHGTATAALIVGKNLGAARESSLYNVKLFSEKQGEIALDTLLDAFDQISLHHNQTPHAVKIVCMPWTLEYNSIVNAVVQSLISTGIIVVCAAGNMGVPIETVSPASTKPALTVGSFNRDFEVSSFNNTAWGDEGVTVEGFVNYGAELDIFALGVDVYIPSISGNDKYITGTGTSISTSIVAGIAAQYVEWYPEKTALDLKEIIIAEGSSWGKQYLVFDEDPSVDYSSVNRSIASTDNSGMPSLTQKPSGRLLNVKIGETRETSLGIHAEAENVEVLDFAPCPPWIQVDIENDVVIVDLVNVDESFPGVGLYLFAVRGDIDGQTYVEEFSVGAYENSENELQDTETLSYYYDADSGEYDGVVLSYTLGKFIDPFN